MVAQQLTISTCISALVRVCNGYHMLLISKCRLPRTACLVMCCMQDFMEDSPAAIAIIADYMEAKNAPKQQPQPEKQQARQHQQSWQTTPPSPSILQQQQQPGSKPSYSSSVAAAAKPTPAQQAAAKQAKEQQWLSLGGQQQPAQAAPDASSTKVWYSSMHCMV